MWKANPFAERLDEVAEIAAADIALRRLSRTELRALAHEIDTPAWEVRRLNTILLDLPLTERAPKFARDPRAFRDWEDQISVKPVDEILSRALEQSQQALSMVGPALGVQNIVNILPSFKLEDEDWEYLDDAISAAAVAASRHLTDLNTGELVDPVPLAASLERTLAGFELFIASLAFARRGDPCSAWRRCIAALPIHDAAVSIEAQVFQLNRTLRRQSAAAPPHPTVDGGRITWTTSLYPRQAS